jgi:WhiB family redox-sensing transcriptional regulator
VALAWDYDLDDEDDWDEYLAGLLAAGPTDPLPATVLERLAAWRPAWMVQAACRGLDVSMFYPSPKGDPAPALRVCAGCAVRVECGAFAAGERHGVWGGVFRAQRRPAA